MTRTAAYAAEPFIGTLARRDGKLVEARGGGSRRMTRSGDDPHYHYCVAASFGALTATAEVRRDVLATLLPKLKIADRVELGDRYVRVRGNKATYKVHLGSANILIEPDDRYLCIVPSSSGRTKRVMLPFEGDEVLTVVLSKVLMLASDDKISDPTILRQIDRRL